jgi:hypothetical protein
VPKRTRQLEHLANFWGVRVPTAQVCHDHRPPVEFLDAWTFDRPSLSLVLGPRGGGKSYLAALATHFDSLRHPHHGTKILGGSLAQSQQIYNALRDFDRTRRGSGVFTAFTKTAATYCTGSEVSILAASPTSVRGPHVPTLRLDEIDEIDPDVRESALGMCMGRHGLAAAVSMTSTWHRLGGPMAGLIDRAKGGDFPLYTYCSFDVLERCPADRSGPWVGGEAGYARCPECPLRPWCHAERDANGDRPLAKLSDGHYAIESLIQKVKSVSARTFAADYLCRGPKADGLWFPTFSAASHVRETAEYDPALPVHLAVDSGVFTGAVCFQVHEIPGAEPTVTVFADYLSEGLTAEANARALRALAETRCQGRLDRRCTDPAGGARNPIGPTVLEEYRRAGLALHRWPLRSVADGLALVESFLSPAAGPPGLLIHPRCTHLIAALTSYRRAKRAGQWMDYPEDPLHPHEELVDSLRGGLVDKFPEGRKPAPVYRRVATGSVF